VFISVIVSLLFSRSNLKENLLDGLIGGFIGAGVVLLTAWIAWKELGEIKNTNSANFIHKLKGDFFKEETRNLITLISLDAIKFTERNGESYFEVDDEKLKNIPDEVKKNLTKKKLYTPYEVDDLLLGHFEDIGLFERKGILDIEMVYEEFEWYIRTVFENSEVNKYIQSERKDESDVYDKFEYIYNKCKSFGKNKMEKNSVLVWKTKWWIKEKLKLD
jgi:hypothetical protein